MGRSLCDLATSFIACPSYYPKLVDIFTRMEFSFKGGMMISAAVKHD